MSEISGKDLAYRTLASVIGGPVDLATMVMRPFGYDVEKPILGSEWIGQKMERGGLVSDARDPLKEFAASIMIPSPSGATAGLSKGAALLPALAGMAKVDKVGDALKVSQKYPASNTSGLPTHLGLFKELADPRYRDYLARSSRESGVNEAMKVFHTPELLGEMKAMSSDKDLLTKSAQKLYFGSGRQPQGGEMFFGAARPLTSSKTRAESYGQVIEVEVPKGSRLVPISVMGESELTLLPGSKLEFKAPGKAVLVDDGTSYTSDLIKFVESLSK